MSAAWIAISTRLLSRQDSAERRPRSAGEPTRRRMSRGKILAAGLVCLLAAVILLELRTSRQQARLLSAVSRGLAYRLEPGPNPQLRYPSAGPYDERLGYSRLNGFLQRLNSAGWEVKAQARPSPAYFRLIDSGLFAIYHERAQAGLSLTDRRGANLYSLRIPSRVYEDFEAIPPTLVRTLLFVENREMLYPATPYRNPAVEWDRLAKAMLHYGLRKANFQEETSGGSTLATQLEKIRHSPGGRTTSPTEKLRQMASASVRAYQDGETTLEARRRIIIDYLNSMPLAAIPGHGEVLGIGDGLWAWYGADFARVNRLLRTEGGSEEERLEQALAYRQALSLILSLKKPSEFLLQNRKSLDARVNSYLPLLAQEGVISPLMRELAHRVRSDLRDRAPEQSGGPVVERKGIDTIRGNLALLLGLESAYELDRLDLRVATTLDASATERVIGALRRFEDPANARESGLTGFRLLDESNPGGVVYSFTLYERGREANVLRVQADNFNQPLNINEGTKLELGSTAKLRTLVTYLDTIAQMHARWESEGALPEPSTTSDRLAIWAREYLAGASDKSLAAMLQAALDRSYPASPAEGFFTGGGLHYFANFDGRDNGRILTVREAFQRSVNLVFIRLMRDIVHYYMYRAPGASPEILRDPKHPRRKLYLERFSDEEGKRLLAQFHARYAGAGPDEVLGLALEKRRLSPMRLAVIYRTVQPGDGPDGLARVLQASLPFMQLTPRQVEDLYQRYAADRFSLNDRGYLAGIHPLELWLAGYLHANPHASLEAVFAASRTERQQANEWLHNSRFRVAQNKRIAMVLEADAFAEIHKSWKRQGYPFHYLVPSYATAIGSSGDNPAALAELAGILLRDGVRYPSLRVRQLHFGEGTPVETIVRPAEGNGIRVLPSAVAAAVRKELVGVVENGTARRAYGALHLGDGRPLDIGGKTGTGDNRSEVYGPGGTLLSSRVRNRTATFVFIIGDRFFGAVTAYVPGEAAAGYSFTSSLPVQVFKNLAPAIADLWDSEVRMAGERAKWGAEAGL